MNLIHIISQLRAERQQLDEVILALERLARAGRKRRGRPFKWMAAGQKRKTAAAKKAAK
jgi:hypothetical protein